MNFKLAPIYWLAREHHEDPFDLSLLPYRLTSTLAIEDIQPRLHDGTFKFWERMIGESAYEALTRSRYALVESRPESPEDGWDIFAAASCLRIIRPMRQNALQFAHGTIRDDGSLDVKGFTAEPRFTEVVEAHKINYLRMRDAELLRSILPTFLHILKGDVEKFKMAVQFHDLGFFADKHWKARFILWTSAIESIFTSNHREHRGSMVAKSRISWLLGENTLIYPDDDWSTFVVPQSDLKIQDVLDPLYELRNFIAHGDRVPDAVSHETLRDSLTRKVCQAEVLAESASFIIRASLLKIIRENLLEHFTDATPANTYFQSHGLTLSELRKRESNR